MEQRQQHDREPVVVARRRPRGVLAHERADGSHVPGGDGGDERVGGHHRTIPQTSSVTSFVNAAIAKNTGGFPFEVSEKLTAPSSIRTR